MSSGRHERIRAPRGTRRILPV